MSQPDQSTELDLHDYVRVLRRRWKLVVLVVAGFVGVALLVSYIQTPVYAAHAQVFLESAAGENVFSGAARSDPGRTLLNELRLIEGADVRKLVQEKLHSTLPVQATAVPNTDFIDVTVRSSKPQQAKVMADAYAEAYVSFRKQVKVDALTRTSAELEAKLNELDAQNRTIDQNITDLQAQGAPATDTRYAALSIQRNGNVASQNSLRDTLQKSEIARNLATGEALITEHATAPSSPIKPRPILNAMVAVVVGGLVGVGLAFLLEYLNESVETKEELERVLKTVPVLGTIPMVDGWKTREETRLVSKESPRSSAAEAYRTLRTAIQFVGLNQPMRILQVTSPEAGEGKTTTLANLGVALATAGERVVIVCCDLRRPRVHEFFGLSNAVGFTSVLLGQRPVWAALQSVPGVPRLKVLASGPLPPNPSELLSSDRTANVLAALLAEADIVLVDSPPVLPVADALVLFRRVDATLLVFSARTTTRKQATTALAMVQQVNGPLIGAVLNGVPAQAGYGYRGRYEAVDTNGAGAVATEVLRPNGNGAVSLPAPREGAAAPSRLARPAAGNGQKRTRRPDAANRRREV
ncbi:MAG: tyrosine-protein kinase [Actinomycetota bacterium]|nr:tyrosine-protein kinase [Actinomycetota bacterium]